jgi:hypothetical protein
MRNQQRQTVLLPFIIPFPGLPPNFVRVELVGIFHA